MSALTIVALDLGTTTGWAVVRLGDPVLGIRPGMEPVRLAGGHVDCNPKGQRPGWRYARLRDALDRLVRRWSPTHVAFEEVRRHEGTRAAHVYGGLRGQLEVVAWEHDLPTIGVAVQDVKRTATGKGNAPKVAVQNAASLVLGSQVTEDEADAHFVGTAAIRYLTKSGSPS